MSIGQTLRRDRAGSAPTTAHAPTAVPTSGTPGSATVPPGVLAPGAADEIEAVLTRHLDDHLGSIEALREALPTIRAWGDELADRLLHGHRLLAAGNGGSAAEAQHLTAEIVGRFDGERRPFSALSLHAETSSVTAIANDYGYDEVFARQIRAHARAGDIVMLFSTSGRSRNLLLAAEAARRVGATTWALTGEGPNPLCDSCDDRIALSGPSAGVQEAQLVALHLLCRVFDARVHRHDEGALPGRDGAPAPVPASSSSPSPAARTEQDGGVR